MGGGDGQNGTVAAPLSNQLTVKVTDSNGKPVPGAAVSWSAGSGSGALQAIGTGTDGMGVAKATWTLGTRAGQQSASATVTGVSAPVGFTAMAAPGPIAAVVIGGAQVRALSALGDTVRVSAGAADAHGNGVPAAPITWSSGSGAIATVDGQGLIRAVGTGATRVTASSGTISDDVDIEVSQAPATVKLQTASATLNAVGRSIQLAAQVSDRNGNPIAAPVLTWTSASPSIAAVDDKGSVVAVRSGVAIVRAASGNAGDSAVVTVRQIAGALELSPATASLGTGGQLALAAVARDSGGTSIDGAAITWRSSDTAVATVDNTGVVRGVAIGTARIDASIGGLVASSNVTVTQAQQITISTTSLAEARQTRPYTASLAAAGGAGGYTWAVESGALPGGLTLQNSGRISGTPAASGDFPLTLSVRDAAGSVASRAVTLRVCDAPAMLAPGESTVRTFPFDCGIVVSGAAGAGYRVAVVARAYKSTGAVAGSIPGGFVLRAGAESASASSFAATAWQPLLDARAHDSEMERLAAATERVHHELREEELRLYGSIEPTPLGPLPAGAMRVIEDPPVKRVFRISRNGAVVEVPATLRMNGSNIIYYEDDGVAGTSERATDVQIQLLLEYYDQHGKPIIDNVFGGLGPEGTTENWIGGARNARDLDNNGKVIVLQLTASRMLKGAAAYVSSCDRFPLQANYNAGQYYCSYSNEGEITYFSKPDSDFYLGTLVHEVKHISSHGYAVFGGRGYQPSWIEEGTAEIAKERSSRAASGFAVGAELRLDDVYPGGLITASGYGMAVVHSRARSFLRAAPVNALTGNPAENKNNSTYYGASWLFHRFLADNYAGSDENAFFLALNRGVTGIVGIEQRVGKSFADLQSEFAAAVSVEGSVGRTNAARRFRSYDFAQIASGFQGGAWPFTLGGQTGFRTADTPLVGVHSGVSFFDFASDTGFQRLDLLDGSAAGVSSGLDAALVITRIN